MIFAQLLAAAAVPTPPPDPCAAMLALVTRPSVTTSACAFKPGRGDIETGYTNTVTTGPGGGVTVAFPQALIRIGTLYRNLELDLTPPGYQRSSVGATLTNGTTDSGLGLKWEIGYTSRAVFAVGAGTTVPSGAQAFTAGAPVYSATLNASYALSPAIGLAATLGFSSLASQTPAGTARIGSFAPSLVATAALPGNAQLFGEVAYQSHAGVGLPGRPLYDFGLQKQIGDHIVLDAETGFAPVPIGGQRAHYVGFGFSYGVP